MTNDLIYYAASVHSFVASQDRDAQTARYVEAVGRRISETVYEDIQLAQTAPMADRLKFQEAVAKAASKGQDIIIHSRSNIGTDAMTDRYNEAREYADRFRVGIYAAGDDPNHMMARSV